MDRLPPEIGLAISNCFVGVEGQRSLAACNRLNKQWHRWTLAALYRTPQIESLRALESFLLTVYTSTQHLYTTSKIEQRSSHKAMWDSPAATSAFTAAFNAQVLTRPQEVVLAATLHGSEPLGHYVREMSLSMIPHRWDQIEGLHLLALCRGCPFLERLDLRDCQRVREVQFWSSIFASPTLPYTLKSLTLSGCHLITDLTISLVCEFMQCLEHLDVSNCETLTDWMLMELASSPEKQTAEEQGRMAEESEMEYRESLMIMDALVLDDFNTKSAGRSGLKKPGRFRFLIKYARSLPSLSLDGPSDTYTLYAGRKPWFPPTASLPNIADNGELSERTAFSRLRVHKTLKHLDISGCISITDVGIEALRQGAEQLQSLNLEGCYGVLMVDNEDLPGAEWEDVTDDSDDEGGGNMP